MDKVSENMLNESVVLQYKDQIEKRAWDDYLIDFCSPTLAGLKCANLFGIAYENEEELSDEIERINRMFISKGIRLVCLKSKNQRALIYVYRKKLLVPILKHKETLEFLAEYGYHKNCDDVDIVIKQLSFRIENTDSFPHEIGVFLGYPLGDVKGFIENAGANSIFCGHWKVYENENQSRKLFHTFDTCKECYRNSYKSGMSVMQLIVAM